VRDWEIRGGVQVFFLARSQDFCAMSTIVLRLMCVCGHINAKFKLSRTSSDIARSPFPRTSSIREFREDANRVNSCGVRTIQGVDSFSAGYDGWLSDGFFFTLEGNRVSLAARDWSAAVVIWRGAHPVGRCLFPGKYFAGTSGLGRYVIIFYPRGKSNFSGINNEIVSFVSHHGSMWRYFCFRNLMARVMFLLKQMRHGSVVSQFMQWLKLDSVKKEI
jgi:hypothetical protein